MFYVYTSEVFLLLQTIQSILCKLSQLLFHNYKNQNTIQSIIWNQKGEKFFFSDMIKNRPRQNLTHQLLLLPQPFTKHPGSFTNYNDKRMRIIKNHLISSLQCTVSEVIFTNTQMFRKEIIIKCKAEVIYRCM